MNLPLTDTSPHKQFLKKIRLKTFNLYLLKFTNSYACISLTVLRFSWPPVFTTLNELGLVSIIKETVVWHEINALHLNLDLKR